MDELAALAASNNIELSEQQLRQFDALFAELIAWNSHTNLTAITEKSDVIKKHFLDSLTVLQAIPAHAHTLLDIGSGAGFPGLAIKIARPDLSVTLLEATRKKTDFHKHVIGILGLEHISSIHGRAEELAREPHFQNAFDCIVARAVAELSIVTGYALPLLEQHGVFIALKNAGTEEIGAAESVLEAQNARITRTIPVTIAGLSPRQLILVEKLK